MAFARASKQDVQQLNKKLDEFHKECSYEDCALFREVSNFVSFCPADIDRDFTPSEHLDLFKLVCYYYNDEKSDSKYILSLLEPILRKSWITKPYSKREQQQYILLDKMGLFKLEVIQAVTNSKLFSETMYYLIKKIADNKIQITPENFIVLINNAYLSKIFIVCLFYVEAKTIFDLTQNEKWKEFAELAEKNIKGILNFVHLFHESELREIFPNWITWTSLIDTIDRGYTCDVYAKLKREDLNVMVNLQRNLQVYIFEDLYYQVPKNQTDFIAILEDSSGPLKGLSSDLTKIITRYAFFPCSYIPRNNLVSLHFLHKSERKDHKNDMAHELKRIENYGAYGTHHAATVLESLGVTNIHAISIDKVSDKHRKMDYFVSLQEKSLYFLEKLASVWPIKYGRYVCVILPTLLDVDGNPQHATLAVVDQEAKTIDCIDPLGARTEGIQQIAKLFAEIKKLDFAKKDLLDEKDAKHQPRMTSAETLAGHLKSFTVILPPEDSFPQQLDQHTCVLHCAANMIGIILRKERKVPSPESDKNTRDFINLLIVDLVTGRGIEARSHELLLNLAGIVLLASEQMHAKQVAEDTMKLAPEGSRMAIVGC